MDRARRQTIKGILLVNVATCAWATNLMIGRSLRGQIGPITLTAARFMIAALVFGLILMRKSPEERRPGKDTPMLLVMALTGVVLFAPTLYFGLVFTTAMNATMINGVAPIITAALAAWFLHEAFSLKQLLGSILALGGVAFILFGNNAEARNSISLNEGDLLVVLAVVFWSMYSVALRRVVLRRSPLSATGLSIFMGLPVLIAMAVLECMNNPVAWSIRLVALVVYVGLVPAALGFICWSAGVKLLGAGGAMVFYNTMPLYGALFAFMLLGETLAPAQLIGGALILGGGLIAALNKKAKTLE